MNAARKRRIVIKQRAKDARRVCAKAIALEEIVERIWQAPEGWSVANVYFIGDKTALKVLTPNHIPELSRRAWLEKVKNDGLKAIHATGTIYIPFKEIRRIEF